MTGALRRAVLDLLLLAAIRQAPGDGEAVRRLVREQAGSRFELSPGTLYPALHRLERNRLVRRSADDPRRYLLTEFGQRSLDRRRREWDGAVAGVNAVLTGRPR
ncbi:MAG TPA: helix-turn-helix transcriptional regulator [Pseudonocardia sp.]|jgi:DNA-binding PadR family transcriptional regulator